MKRDGPDLGPWWAWLAAATLAIILLGAGPALAWPPATDGWPAAKARLYEEQQRALAQARLQPRPKRPAAGVPPAAQAPPRRQAGIVAMRQGPFPPSTFTVRDFWQGPVGSDWILVYAGAARDSPLGAPARGALRLYSETAGLHLTEIGTFLAPTGTGPLTVTASNGVMLRLRTDDGATLWFNLETRQFG